MKSLTSGLRSIYVYLSSILDVRERHCELAEALSYHPDVLGVKARSLDFYIAWLNEQPSSCGDAIAASQGAGSTSDLPEHRARRATAEAQARLESLQATPTCDLQMILQQRLAASLKR